MDPTAVQIGPIEAQIGPTGPKLALEVKLGLSEPVKMRWAIWRCLGQLDCPGKREFSRYGRGPRVATAITHAP